ncbi:UNVERIFIED_ORG: hypothetical protein ABIC58_000006 [Leuconostoc holzapfelii]
MVKMNLENAIEWAAANNLNNTWVTAQKEDAKKDWTNAIFLLRGVTDYINLHFNQGLDLDGSDVSFAITDQTAHNIFERVQDKSEISTKEDLGIDAIILISEDGQLINTQDNLYKSIKNIILFQSKNSSTPKSFEKEFKNAPNHFRDLLNGLIEDSNEYRETLPGKLMTKIIGMGIKRLEGATITNVYITASSASQSAHNMVPIWMDQLSGFPLDIRMISGVSEVEVQNTILVTIDEMEQKIEEQKQILRVNNVTNYSESKSLNIANLNYQPFYSNKATAYQGLAYLRDYANFLNEENNQNFDEKLINDNVRGAQGNGRAANKAIRKLLSNDEDDTLSKYIDFWWLNNGITIIAKDLQQTAPNKILLQNPQIVNGQQTSRQIFELQSNNFNSEWKIKISLIVIPNDDGISEQIKNKIIIGVNTQTPVTISNTLGLDSKIRHLSEYIKLESAGKVLLSVKSEKISDSDITYPYEFLIQMIVAGFYRKPGEARRGISALIKEYFELIFSEHNTENNTLVINSWINFMTQVKKYDEFYKEKDWSIYGEGKQKSFELGDNYGYLGIFTFINENISGADKDLNDFSITNLDNKNYNITKEKFIDALDRWHKFMDDSYKKEDPDGYTKSTRFSIDINKEL